MKHNKLITILGLAAALNLTTSCSEKKVLNDDTTQKIETTLKLPKAKSEGIYELGENHALKYITHTKSLVAKDGYQSTVVFSDKKVKIEQDYKVQLGFVLGREIRLKEIGLGMIEIQGLNEFKILSLEPIGKPRYDAEEGWWNRMTDSDKLILLTQLHDGFKKELEDDNYAAQFKEEAIKYLSHSIELEPKQIKYAAIPKSNDH